MAIPAAGFVHPLVDVARPLDVTVSDLYGTSGNTTGNIVHTSRNLGPLPAVGQKRIICVAAGFNLQSDNTPTIVIDGVEGATVAAYETSDAACAIYMREVNAGLTGNIGLNFGSSRGHNFAIYSILMDSWANLEIEAKGANFAPNTNYLNLPSKGGGFAIAVASGRGTNSYGAYGGLVQDIQTETYHSTFGYNSFSMIASDVMEAYETYGGYITTAHVDNGNSFCGVILR